MLILLCFKEQESVEKKAFLRSEKIMIGHNEIGNFNSHFFPYPFTTEVDMKAVLLLSPMARCGFLIGSTVFVTGSLSPVNSDSITCRLIASNSRRSAGIVSPSSRRTTSPENSQCKLCQLIWFLWSKKEIRTHLISKTNSFQTWYQLFRLHISYFSISQYSRRLH